MFGDFFGRIICYFLKGISMFDYFIVSYEMFNLIGNFIVEELMIFLDYF